MSRLNLETIVTKEILITFASKAFKRAAKSFVSRGMKNKQPLERGSERRMENNLPDNLQLLGFSQNCRPMLKRHLIKSLIMHSNLIFPFFSGQLLDIIRIRLTIPSSWQLYKVQKKKKLLP